MTADANFAELLGFVAQHNTARIAASKADPHLDTTSASDPSWFSAEVNYLLPMAFAEDSPMHPSYGAGMQLSPEDA